MPDVIDSEEVELGPWADDHPLNYSSTDKSAWLRGRQEVLAKQKQLEE